MVSDNLIELGRPEVVNTIKFLKLDKRTCSLCECVFLLWLNLKFNLLLRHLSLLLCTELISRHKTSLNQPDFTTPSAFCRRWCVAENSSVPVFLEQLFCWQTEMRVAIPAQGTRDHRNTAVPPFILHTVRRGVSRVELEITYVTIEEHLCPYQRRVLNLFYVIFLYRVDKSHHK